MKYAKQTQGALDRLDQSLARLLTMIKRGERQEAILFMTEGELKEKYEELQNIITLSKSNPLGASGISSTQPL